MAADIDLAVLDSGSTYRFRGTLKKDGAAWPDIDSATLRFEAPDRSTRFDRSMILESANIWYYDSTLTDFLDSDGDPWTGRWTVRVAVVDGSITQRSPREISFEVSDQP